MIAEKTGRNEKDGFVQDTRNGQLYTLEASGMVTRMLKIDEDGRVDWCPGQKVEIDVEQLDADERAQRRS